MRWTCLLISFLVFTVSAHAGHSAPKVTLRVHIQTTGEGQSPLEATSISLPPNGEQIQLRALPEASESQLIGVQPGPNGSTRLQFNHAAQVDISAATAQNQGRILVVLIDGYVVYAPIIDEQITSGELDIPTPLDPKVVALLQEVARENVRQAAKS